MRLRIQVAEIYIDLLAMRIRGVTLIPELSRETPTADEIAINAKNGALRFMFSSLKI